jgi:hypothetical protein
MRSAVRRLALPNLSLLLLLTLGGAIQAYAGAPPAPNGQPAQQQQPGQASAAVVTASVPGSGATGSGPQSKTDCSGDPSVREPAERMHHAQILSERFRSVGDQDRARLADALAEDWLRVCRETRKAIALEAANAASRLALAQQVRDAAKGKIELEEGFAKLERLRAQVATKERERVGATREPEKPGVPDKRKVELVAPAKKRTDASDAVSPPSSATAAPTKKATP